ncbi:hypothetical protein [Acetobacter fallax]|uniref:Uncharacterized protein n=1 Tax=Acetobacter fallax TaxID=1737473 RepID=A0ABX0KH31_9PROT|nr:hypothetical protein [Acetobacter fallax]NHO34303.1 hypothetical protein [Acetobacter fallax]NHO37859.1 hypothetical protein [Acetobacter fallax]
MRHEIRDQNYHFLGVIEQDGSHLIARDSNYHTVGYYRDGKTYDDNHHLVAYGNVLSYLIYCAD